jgi:hypothetical protein
MQMPQDFVDLLAAFAQAQVRYLVVGGYAVGVHDVPRFTKDIDLLIEPTAENVARCAQALQAFGAPAGVVQSMCDAGRDDVVWLGHAPLRIDLLQWIPGVAFAQAWERKTRVEWSGTPVWVIGLDDLIAAKVAAGRPQDKVDAQALRKVARRSGRMD